MDDKQKNLAEGRARLRQWLPAARLKALALTGSLKPTQNGLGNAVFSVLREANLDAVLIYPAPQGGWHGDVVFKDLPLGVANSMGTQVGSPAPSREHAEAVVRALLEGCVAQALHNERMERKPAPPVFLLYGLKITLLPDILQGMRAEMPELLNSSSDIGVRLITESLAELATIGCEPKGLGTWPREMFHRLITILHIASLTGLLRYPPLPDGKPAELAEGSTQVH